jgi:peptidoglycan/LPS O-acetylase OafA/YrhL
MFKIIKDFKIGPGQFRFLLAFLVLMYHSLEFFPLGHYAVYVFFLLSGYWIFKMYEEKYRYYKNSYLVYIRSRLMRLMFVYWLILAIAIGVFFIKSNLLNNHNWQGFSVTEVFLKNIFVLGLNSSPIIFITTAWSLEVEIQFYLAVPLFVMLRKYINIKVQLVMSLLILAVLIYLIPVDSRTPNLFFSLPFFLIGAWMYYSGKVFSQKTVNIFLGSIATILLINIFVPDLRAIFLVKTESRFGIDQYQDHINMLLALLTIPFLTRNITQKISDPNDGTWSSMSFVIYLVHWPIIKLYNTANILQGDSHKLLNLILLYAASLSLSYLIAIKYDKYFEGIRRKWLKKQQKQIASTPVLSSQ